MPNWFPPIPGSFGTSYLALFVEPGSAPFPREIVHRPDIAKYAEAWGRAGDFGFKGMLHDEIVGMIWGCRFPEGDRRYGYVDGDTPGMSMAVLPEYRDKGCGSLMLRRFLEEAATLDVDVSLSVDSANPAKALYEKSGFVRVSSDGRSETMIRSTRKRKS